MGQRDATSMLSTTAVQCLPVWRLIGLSVQGAHVAVWSRTGTTHHHFHLHLGYTAAYDEAEGFKAERPARRVETRFQKLMTLMLAQPEFGLCQCLRGRGPMYKQIIDHFWGQTGAADGARNTLGCRQRRLCRATPFVGPMEGDL